MPRGFRKRGQFLLEQQCWLWGRDVRHEAGNALLAHGFDRARPPHDVVGASAYRLQLLPDDTQARERVVALWGFGIWFGQADDKGEIGGIFIGRSGFEPRWSARALPPRDAWSPAPILAATRAPQGREERRQTRILLTNALTWIADYESWALARYGLDDRARQLNAWRQSHGDPIPPDELSREWKTLAHRLL